MGVKRLVIKMFREHREDIYRCFSVCKWKFKIFSHKYAFRELQSEIRRMQDENNIIKQDVSLLIDLVKDLKQKNIENNSQINMQLKQLQEKYDETNSKLNNQINDVIKKQETTFRSICDSNNKLVNGAIKNQETVLRSILNDLDRELHSAIETTGKATKLLETKTKQLESKDNKILAKTRRIENTVFGPVPNYTHMMLELTNKCAYHCFCCPRDLITRPKKEITDDDIRLVALRLGKQLAKPMRIFTDGMGDVLLLEDLLHKIQVIKEAMPNFQPVVVTTLGYEKEDSFWNDFVTSGITYVQVSVYGYSRENYQQIHGYDGFDIMMSNLQKLASANKEKCGEVKIDISLDGFSDEIYSTIPDYDFSRHHEDRKEFIRFIQSLPGISYFERKIHNRGCGLHLAEPSEVKNCFTAEFPMRKEILSITCDLKVIPCCMIFNEELILGDLREQTLEEIYTSDRYLKFMKAMQSGDLSEYPSCINCNL